MKECNIENNILSCILQNNKLIEELFIDIDCMTEPYNKRLILFFKEFYKENKNLDISLMINALKTDEEKNQFIDYCSYLITLAIPNVTLFYEYQQELINQYRDNKIKFEIKDFIKKKIDLDELIESINQINNESLVIKVNNKRTPEEMIAMIRNKKKTIKFPRFWALNEKLQIKKRTINVIGARPSEGKSALALNLFCDLAKEYRCLYFNMEMTEEEVYERMLAIESDLTIKNILSPLNEKQDEEILNFANKIYNYKYEVINGSKTVNSIKNKIIKEQRDEHVIVFIDYIGYIVGKNGETDKDRIGNAVRELNNITKDYDCTVFLVAQINRNGHDEPTMQDLKDSGELEQSADTIILIHDKNKEDNSDIKNIDFLIPKCRGGKRNIAIPVEFNKLKQRMSIE